MSDAHPLDQLGCDSFCIHHGFIRCHVEVQVLCMDAPEGAQVGPEGRPGPFAGMAVNLASAIPIIIPCPFAGAVAHGGVGGVATVIARPCICVQHGAASWDVLREQVVAGPCGRVVTDPEALLARVPRDKTDNGRTVVGIGPVPSPLMGTPTGRIIGVRMGRAFFPPRFGTARLPQRQCPA